MVVIVSKDTGTAHVVGDVHRYDDLVEDGLYAQWSDCGISVTGELFRKVHRRKGHSTFNKKCKKCFR